MKEYTVVWVIQVQAMDVHEAALKARDAQAAGTEATVFDVIEGKKVYSVDLASDDGHIPHEALRAYKKTLAFSEMEDAIRTYEQLHKAYKDYVYLLPSFPEVHSPKTEQRIKVYREIKRLERDVPEP